MHFDNGLFLITFASCNLLYFFSFINTYKLVYIKLSGLKIEIFILLHWGSGPQYLKAT